MTLKTRRELITQLVKAKETGKYAIMKYDKLIISDEKVNSKKRELNMSTTRRKI